MVVALKSLKFGTLLSALHEAGVETGSARGSWGAITANEDIVVTSWIDARVGKGFFISRPHTNHGGLRDAWDIGRIKPGATLRLIIIRQRGDVPFGAEGREVKDAALVPGRWRVVKLIKGDHKRAIIEPASASAKKAA